MPFCSCLGWICSIICTEFAGRVVLVFSILIYETMCTMILMIPLSPCGSDFPRWCDGESGFAFVVRLTKALCFLPIVLIAMYLFMDFMEACEMDPAKRSAAIDEEDAKTIVHEV